MTVFHQVALSSIPSSVLGMLFLRVLEFDPRAPCMGSLYSPIEALPLLYVGMCELRVSCCDNQMYLGDLHLNKINFLVTE